MNRIIEGTEEVDAEGLSICQTTTRHIGLKRIPVAMVTVMMNLQNYLEAMQSPIADDWQKAVTADIESLEKTPPGTSF